MKKLAVELARLGERVGRGNGGARVRRGRDRGSGLRGRRDDRRDLGLRLRRGLRDVGKRTEAHNPCDDDRPEGGKGTADQEQVSV